MKRLDSLLLTGVGVLLVHQGAYTVSSLAGYKAAVTHGHLEVAWLLGSLTAIGALTRAVTRSLRRRRDEHDRLVTLAMWIVAGYLGLETVERVANNLPATSLFGEPVFWFGLLFAPLVAVLLQWSMRTVAHVVAKVVTPRPRTSPSRAITRPLGTTSIDLASHVFLTFALSRRGPPRLMHA